MSDEIKKTLNEALNGIKETIEEKTKDVVTDEKFNKLQDEVIKQGEALQKAEQEAMAVKAAMQMSGTNEKGDGLSDQDKKYADLVDGFMRSGNNEAELKSITLEEQKTLGSYSGAAGGYTVPRVMLNKIIKRIFETSPLRLVASNVSISSNSAEFMLDDEEFSQGWTSETGSRTETANGEFGKRTIAVHEQYAKPKATQNLLDDSVFGLEAWIADKVTDKFARTENTAFVSGIGAGQPRGLLTYTSGSATYNREEVEQVNLGASAALTGTGLIELQNSLKAGYQANAAWMMKRSTYGALLELMYTDNKFHALTRDSINGETLALLGKRIILADDIPAVAANALSVVYGDFSQGYQIVDRQGVNLLRDPYSAKPFVEFYFTKRVGGDVLNTEALKIGKIAT